MTGFSVFLSLCGVVACSERNERRPPLRSDWFLYSSQFVFRSGGVMLLCMWF